MLKLRLSVKRSAFCLMALILICASSQVTEACYGAQALGMGGAYVALAQGAEGIYWNPGGAAFAGKSTFVMTQNLPPESINYQSFLGAVFSVGDVALGLGYTGLADFVSDRYWLQMVASVQVFPWLGVGMGKRLCADNRFRQEFFRIHTGRRLSGGKGLYCLSGDRRIQVLASLRT